MTFKQAAAKIKKIADGRYCGLQFQVTFPRPEYPPETRCEVYITVSPTCWLARGRTWAEAFSELDAQMNSRPAPIEEIPNISDKEASCLTI